MLLNMARNPEPDSQFERRTRDIRHLDDDGFLAALQKRGYDVALCEADGHFVGLAAHQWHATECHSFHFLTSGPHRVKNVATFLLTQLILKSLGRGILTFFVWGEDQLGTLSEENATAMRKLHRKALDNRLPIPRCLISAGTRPGELVLELR
jgi:hypothetical protein